MFSVEPQVGLAVSCAAKKLRYSDTGLIHRLIRRALIAAGLGVLDIDAPFKDVIRPGATVLLKPNWVFHHNLSGQGQECMITHPRFIDATVDEVLLTKPGRIIIGDAPIQGACFSSLYEQGWLDRLYSRAGDCKIEIIDFRRRRARFLHGRMFVEEESRPRADYVLFDLGVNSMLEPISTPPCRFRVTKYSHQKLANNHRPGVHRYLICRELFDSDVVISLPKLKTHCKTGLTGALKNIVGFCGEKDYLPHHRVGGKKNGGDCYEGYRPLKRFAEHCLDRANDSQGYVKEVLWRRTAQGLVFLNKVFLGDTQIEGSWSGNDTAWRMVLDLNRIALCGRSDGTISETPVRVIHSLTDAIVAGQGDGPLRPIPLRLGAVTYSTSSPLADLVHTAMMQLKWRRLPLVANSSAHYFGGIANVTPADIKIGSDDEVLSLADVSERYGLSARPPRFWMDIVAHATDFDHDRR